MANREIIRSGSSAASSAPFITGLEPLPTSTAPLDASMLAFEHILASIARVEARLDTGDRQPVSTPPPRRPDPDPPYTDQRGGRKEQFGQGPIMTTAVSMATQQQFGLAGPSATRGPSPWAPLGGDTRVTQHTAWSNPAHRQERQTGGRQTAWDSPPVGRGSADHYYEPQRYDQHRYEKPRYDKMKAPRFDGSEVVNWKSKVQFYFEHMGTPEDHRLHYVVMIFEGPASEWIFNYRENNPSAIWADFLEDVRRRFDPQCFQNFIGLIAKLCQTGSLAEYNSAFETMLNRVRGVPEYILLPIYVEGLLQPVKNQVKHQHPASVAAAMALAVEYDSCIVRASSTVGFQRRSGGRYEQRQQGQQPPATSPASQH